MSNTILIALLLIAALSGCTEKQPEKPSQTVKITDMPADFNIPKDLLKIVEDDLLLDSKILTPVFIYTPLEIIFTEKTSGTLASPVMQITLPKGGGTMDLKSIVAGQGSFYVSFPQKQFKGLPPLEHLFYISESPKKEIGSEEFGLGCAKWVDLKNKFEDLQKPNFLNLNTTDNRHLFVLAGHYLFVFRRLNQIYLTQVTITDSKNSFQLCPQFKGAFL